MQAVGRHQDLRLWIKPGDRKEMYIGRAATTGAELLVYQLGECE